MLQVPASCPLEIACFPDDAGINIRESINDYLMTPLPTMTVPEAAQVLGISGMASMITIRTRYRELVKEWHPDVSEQTPDIAHDMFIRIHDAYCLLEDYCMNYEISFEPEDVRIRADSDTQESWMDRFGDDPIWGRNTPH